MASLWRYTTHSLFCSGDGCDQQLVDCGNVDVTAAGCSHPVSSACHYQPTSSTSPSSFKAAVCHTHFNTPDSFDRLYGLIILNIYRSHFPKPSMFIQHLGDHSMAPFSAPHPHSTSRHTQNRDTYTFLFSPFSLLWSCFPPLVETPRDLRHVKPGSSSRHKCILSI